ncbi:DUF262 domain-containing protein [Bacillus subtilis]|uniref:GmrSD restriction endonuclease domain-containing protein n=2 Tax=Bacillus subtilis TaxID=1423 RepID=UPI000F497B17|nr:DUF262 domain-containing protein [Bacillus subtilis]MCL6426822.1 DUF262 domain-containing protein [Bacillus subtilis]MEA1022844.1 DUF262 domain-containing protein [Bacillus subtilis]ROT27657.1 DUF262 domain-containing protein [Bacillus subtilis]
MADPISIRSIINNVVSGEIRIPSFQRSYVWTSEQVAFLLDSIYKGIPIGNIFLWKTSETLKIEKDFGNFSLPSPEKDYPIKYVLDGQQRLTSLFSVFQNIIEPTKQNHNWIDIYFDYVADENMQESLFIPLAEAEVNLNRHFPMNAMFDSVKYRKATAEIPADYIETIDRVQEKFKEVMIPVQEIETEDKGKVAIVFERINRSGTELDTFQLLTAWTWSSEFDLQDEIEKLADELNDFGFGDISEDKDLLLKCCSGVILGEASPKSIMSLNGEEVRNNFEKIKNGIKGSIDFLQRELNIESIDVMPYTSMIVSLTRFFATNKKNGILYTDKQRRELLRWFWRSCFSRRYTSGVTHKHKQDLQAMDKLKVNEEQIISDFECNINTSFFTENQFNLGSINTKTYVITLASKLPSSFISGAKVNLKNVLKNSSRNEFHHIFPKNHLKDLGKTNKEINVLANLCFLNNTDNQKIKDKAPAVYQDLLPKDRIKEILESHLCPSDTFNLTYEQFIQKRSELLKLYALELIK